MWWNRRHGRRFPPASLSRVRALPLFLILATAIIAAALFSACGLATMEVKLTAHPESGPAPLTVDFVMFSDDWHDPDRYDWSYGDGTFDSSGNRRTEHTYTSTGTYYAYCFAVVKKALGGDITESDSIRVTVNLPDDDGNGELEVEISADPTSGCPSEELLTIDFTSTVTGGTPPYAYEWDFGNGDKSFSANTSYNGYPALPATYFVTLTVWDDTEAMVVSEEIVIDICGGES